MKKTTTILLIMLAVLLLVCSLILFLAGYQVRRVPEPVSIQSEPEETICLYGLTALPDPYTWFGRGEEWKPAAGPCCRLTFGKNPEPVVQEYIDLMVEEYGLTELPQEGIAPMGIVLGDAKTGEAALTITWAMLDGAPYGFLIFDFSDDYTTVPGPAWDGELTDYIFAENDWKECKTCKGTGDCPKCHGRGFVTVTDIDDNKDTVDCTRCTRGECPNPDCYQSRIPKGR